MQAALFGERERNMHYFNSLSIRGKVVGAFAAVLLFTAALGIFAITRVDALAQDSVGLEANVQAIEPFGAMAKDAHELVGLVEQAQLAPGAQLPDILAEEDKDCEDFAKRWGSYAPTMDPGQESEAGNGFNAAWTQMNATISQITPLQQAGNVSAATPLILNRLVPELRAFRMNMIQAVMYQDRQAKALALASNAASAASVEWIAIVLGIMLLGTLLVGWAMIRAISGPVGAMTEAMRRLAQQDMHVEIPGIGRRDEIGAMADAVQVFKVNGQARMKLEAEAAEFQKNLDAKVAALEASFEVAGREQKHILDALAFALAGLAKGDLTVRLPQEVAVAYQGLQSDFNLAVSTLQETMRAIHDTTDGVRAGAVEITQASDDLSRRSEQQAAGLEETAAALDEITATVRKTAENAREARNTANAAKTDAEHSGAVVRDTVDAMQGIAESSKQIGNIIGLIDEVAFQTNLLALNAGVEAARAGDAGRGFAVVATEVRALAQRSADAAREIKALISTSRQQVDGGVKLVGETGKAIGRIVEQVARLNALIGEIAASAQEQATGLNEVNSAVNQMDQITQQNAAMVEESTAASHGLAGEAEALARLIGQFEIGRNAPRDASGHEPAPVSRGGARPQGKRAAHLNLIGR
jgi:methyl-accepting chemotaxis protein